jgi:hypothetical protein
MSTILNARADHTVPSSLLAEDSTVHPIHPTFVPPHLCRPATASRRSGTSHAAIRPCFRAGHTVRPRRIATIDFRMSCV